MISLFIGSQWSLLEMGQRGTVGMSNVQCTGNETNLVDCEHVGYDFRASCAADVNLTCLLEPESGTIGDLRITSISNEDNYTISGSLEVFNGAWGFVCADYFGRQDANVACRQMGYIEGGKTL